MNLAKALQKAIERPALEVVNGWVIHRSWMQEFPSKPRRMVEAACPKCDELSIRMRAHLHRTEKCWTCAQKAKRAHLSGCPTPGTATE